MDKLYCKTIIYKILVSPLTWYRNKYIPPYEHVGWPPEEWIRDYEEARI